MSTSKCLSPTKENFSPSKIKTSEQLTQQLISFIKKSAVQVPPSLNKLISQKQPLKLISTASSKETNEEKKLKVKLSDIEFQLKKTEEDFAEYKRNARIQKEKEIKKWEENYNRLKANFEESSQDSCFQVKQIQTKYEKMISDLKAKYSTEMKEEVSNLKSFYENKLSTQKKQLERQIQELKDKHKTKVNELSENYQGELHNLKSTHQFQTKKIQLKNKEIIEEKEKQFESVYVALKSEKKTQQKLHEKTKIQSNQAKEQLYNDLFYERNTKKDLESTINKKDFSIKQLKIQIKDLENSLVLQREKAQKKLTETEQDYEMRIQGIHQIYKEEKAKVLNSHMNQINRLDKRIREMNAWKNEKQTLINEKMEEIQSKFDERPSRKEDLEAIEKLKGRVHRKEEQNKALKNELKNCALEIQNKQQTYNRIFTSSCGPRPNVNNKKSLNKERQQLKSRQNLCRKSQTTDLKFLLKVYNKHI